MHHQSGETKAGKKSSVDSAPCKFWGTIGTGLALAAIACTYNKSPSVHKQVKERGRENKWRSRDDVLYLRAGRGEDGMGIAAMQSSRHGG
jgi:hypothetical protein